MNRSKPIRGAKIKPTYYSGSNKPATNSPFTKKRPPKQTFKIRVKHILSLVTIVLILAGLVFCSFVKSPAKVLITDTSYHSLTSYESAVAAGLKALRNHNKLTFDRGGISQSLQNQFPEIDKVRIDLPLVSQIPTFRLTIAAPTFNFTSGGRQFIVGSNGVVTSPGAKSDLFAGLPTLIDQSGFEAAPGKQVLGTNSISFINSLIAQTEHAKVKIISLTLPAAPQELDLRVDGSGYYVKFDLSGDVILQAGQYLAAKHKFDSEGNGPSQYLDVRVAGKIYYK